MIRRSGELECDSAKEYNENDANHPADDKAEY